MEKMEETQLSVDLFGEQLSSTQCTDPIYLRPETEPSAPAAVKVEPACISESWLTEPVDEEGILDGVVDYAMEVTMARSPSDAGYESAYSVCSPRSTMSGVGPQQILNGLYADMPPTPPMPEEHLYDLVMISEPRDKVLDWQTAIVGEMAVPDPMDAPVVTCTTQATDGHACLPDFILLSIQAGGQTVDNSNSYNLARNEDEKEDEDEDESMTDDSGDEDYVPDETRGDNKRHPAVGGNSVKVRPKADLPGLPSSKRSRRKTSQLWVFLLECLCDEQFNPSIIKWTDWQKGLFKLTDAHSLSKIWGQRAGIKPGKKPMNYEKFSRAMRYYYSSKVLVSVSGRLTYQFGPMATGWKQAARKHNSHDE